MYGGNLGSVARAMANFGLDDLTLVNPAPGIFDDPTLAPMARDGAGRIRSARICTALEEALADTEIALGFSTRVGKLRRGALELRTAVERIVAEAPSAQIAGVFGREDRGLTNADLDRCHWLVRIPTHPQLTSLNLSHAVGLFAYEIHLLRKAGTPLPKGRSVATVAELEGMYVHFERVLDAIGFIEEKSPKRMMNQIRAIFSRRLPDPREVRILRGVLSKVELTLERERQKGKEVPG